MKGMQINNLEIKFHLQTRLIYLAMLPSLLV